MRVLVGPVVGRPGVRRRAAVEQTLRRAREAVPIAGVRGPVHDPAAIVATGGGVVGAGCRASGQDAVADSRGAVERRCCRRLGRCRHGVVVVTIRLHMLSAIRRAAPRTCEIGVDFRVATAGVDVQEHRYRIERVASRRAARLMEARVATVGAGGRRVAVNTLRTVALLSATGAMNGERGVAVVKDVDRRAAGAAEAGKAVAPEGRCARPLEVHRAIAIADAVAVGRAREGVLVNLEVAGAPAVGHAMLQDTRIGERVEADHIAGGVLAVDKTRACVVRRGEINRVGLEIEAVAGLGAGCSQQRAAPVGRVARAVDHDAGLRVVGPGVAVPRALELHRPSPLAEIGEIGSVRQVGECVVVQLQREVLDRLGAAGVNPHARHCARAGEVETRQPPRRLRGLVCRAVHVVVIPELRCAERRVAAADGGADHSHAFEWVWCDRAGGPGVGPGCHRDRCAGRGRRHRAVDIGLGAARCATPDEAATAARGVRDEGEEKRERCD